MNAPSTIRVLRLIARMNVGGPALQVVGLTEALDREGFDSRLLTGRVGADEGDFLSLRAPHIEAVVVEGLGRRVSPVSDVRAFVGIVSEIRRFRPDIVHTHTAKAGVLGRLAARLCRVPVVVHTYHGHLLTGYFSVPMTRAVVMIERTLARITTVIAAVGGRVRDELLAAGVGRPDQYVVVPPGVPEPPDMGRWEARATLGLGEDRPVVAYVGRIAGVKRPDRFVDTARLIADRNPEVAFVVAGGGVDEALMRDQAKRAGLGERMVFLGWRRDIEVVYGAADVVVLTSDNEGMPVSLIEAQMCGVPVVATRVGSVPEVVENGVTGLVVSPDAGELASAVLALLDDPGLRGEMGRRARLRSRKLFSQARLITDTASIYRRALAGR